MDSWTRTLLLRHGEVDVSWHNRIYGGHDVALSPRGERQSQAAAHVLGPADTGAVVTSGLARTEALGLLLVRAGDAPRREPALVELDRGEWLGLTWEQLGGGGEARAWKAWWTSGGRTRPPGGESLEDLRERVVPAVRSLVHEHAGQTLTLVAHSWVHRMLVAHALGLSVEGTLHLHFPTGGLAVLDWHRDGRVLLAGFRPGALPNPA
jgi:broad specificity phosphatase PhoE